MLTHTQWGFDDNDEVVDSFFKWQLSSSSFSNTRRGFRLAQRAAVVEMLA